MKINRNALVAKEVLKMMIEQNSGNGELETVVNEACNYAIEVLDKNLPKPYVMQKAFAGTINMPHCQCGKMLEGNIKYCPHCGQLIDWGDYDDWEDIR